MIEGYIDIKESLKNQSLAKMLAWQDIKQRYRRSALGPIWITLSLSIMIITMGIIFSKLYHIETSEYLPFLCTGLIIWGFFSSTITDSCSSLISSQAIIKQLPIPIFTYLLKVIYKNLIILGHNILIYPVLLLIFNKNPGLIIILAIPGILLLTLNLGWISLLLALICTRYRDVSQIVTSILQIITYITPIMWMPKSLSTNASYYFVFLNPVHHMLNVIRAPLLGDYPSVYSWIFSCSMAIIGWIIAIYFLDKNRKKITLWV